MLLPYHVDVPMERLPWMNWLLIVATTLMGIGVLVSPWPPLKPAPEPNQEVQMDDEEAATEETDEGLRVPPLALKPTDFSVVQLFTYQFSHAGLFHLIGNMIFLFVFGNAVNAKLGQVGFLAAYLLLGALAGLAWLVVGGGRPLVGASGSIMGLVGIFLVLFPRNHVQVLYWWWFGSLTTQGSFEVPSGWIIAFYVIGDLFGCLFGFDGGIAYVAHLVGTLGGVVLTVGLFWMGWLESTEYEENLLQFLGLQPKQTRDDRPLRRESKKRSVGKRGTGKRRPADKEWPERFM